jgi:hypothetical protein
VTQLIEAIKQLAAIEVPEGVKLSTDGRRISMTIFETGASTDYSVQMIRENNPRLNYLLTLDVLHILTIK